MALTLPADGAPVAGKLVKPFQPDGTQLEVLCWGDEYYVVSESLDGYTLIRDPQTGFICYAQLSPDGTRLVSTGVPARTSAPATLTVPAHLRIKPESAAAQALAVRAAVRRPLAAGPPLPAGTTGDVRGICLLVDFSDDVATVPSSDVENFCNQVGYTGFSNNGSVRDYYYDVSYANLTFTHYVPTVYYRAQQPKSYYASPSVKWGIRGEELVEEALTSLNNSGFDFSQYDADHNGRVDAVSCFYAGFCTNNWSEGLWPGHIGMWTNWVADGVSVTDFQMTDMGSVLTLETFCHECGHMVMGWPDLYDYDFNSFGVGQFCIMCQGANPRNPVEPCAYMKMRAGWMNVIDLGYRQDGITATAGTNTVYRVQNVNAAQEYFLIENRQRKGRDSALPTDGLAIWHVDTTGNNSREQMTPDSHYLVTLVQADGNWDLEKYINHGDSSDLYGAPAHTACTIYTYPNTHWWDGNASTVFIENITASADTMSFSFDYQPGVWVDFAYSGPELSTFLLPFNTLTEGLAAVPPHGNLWIKAGSTPETAAISTPMVIRSYGGKAILGQ